MVPFKQITVDFSTHYFFFLHWLLRDSVKFTTHNNDHIQLPLVFLSHTCFTFIFNYPIVYVFYMFYCLKLKELILFLKAGIDL